MTEHYPGLETNTELPMPSMEELVVDQWVHAIEDAARALDELWRLRLRNDTADLLCLEYEALNRTNNILSALCEDIRQANANGQEAA